jgi:hypothetical protein
MYLSFHSSHKEQKQNGQGRLPCFYPNFGQQKALLVSTVFQGVSQKVLPDNPGVSAQRLIEIYVKGLYAMQGNAMRECMADSRLGSRLLAVYKIMHRGKRHEPKIT